MATLKETIQQDLTAAMKERNQELVTHLRGLMAAIKQVEVDTRGEVDDGKVLSIVQKEVKKRKEALKFAEDAGRDDLIAQNKEEIELLSQYLGEQLSEGDLRSMITKLVDEGADNIGKVMGALNANHKGQFDGRMASEIAKELFAGK